MGVEDSSRGAGNDLAEEEGPHAAQNISASMQAQLQEEQQAWMRDWETEVDEVRLIPTLSAVENGVVMQESGDESIWRS